MQNVEAHIIIVGAGLAGLSAALTAHERGAKVVVLECAPEAERGGNTRFSNGAMRAVYQGLADVEELVGEIGAEERAHTDFGAYTAEEYFDDLARVTQYRTDSELADLPGREEPRHNAMAACQRGEVLPALRLAIPLAGRLHPLCRWLSGRNL